MASLPATPTMTLRSETAIGISNLGPPDTMPAPVLVLRTKEEVAEAMRHNLRPDLDSGLDRYSIRAEWLIELITRMKEEGTETYNSAVKRRAEQELGYDEQDDSYYASEDNRLSVLIYNAQRYLRHDRWQARLAELTVQGYEIATPQMLRDALLSRSRLETPSGDAFTLREVNGEVLAFRPRVRRRAVILLGWPVRPVKKETKR